MDNKIEAKLRGCLHTYFATDKFFNNHIHTDEDEYLCTISRLTDDITRAIKNANFKTVEKFLFVEDGSCNTDDIESLYITNPEIKVVVIRQGGRMPVLQEVKQ